MGTCWSRSIASSNASGSRSSKESAGASWLNVKLTKTSSAPMNTSPTLLLTSRTAALPGAHRSDVDADQAHHFGAPVLVGGGRTGPFLRVTLRLRILVATQCIVHDLLVAAAAADHLHRHMFGGELGPGGVRQQMQQGQPGLLVGG